MASAKVTSKVQIKLPKSALKRLGIKAGDQIEFVEYDHGVLLRRVAADIRIKALCQIHLRRDDEPGDRQDGAVMIGSAWTSASSAGRAMAILERDRLFSHSCPRARMS